MTTRRTQMSPNPAAKQDERVRQPAGEARAFSSAGVAFLIGVPLLWAILLLFWGTYGELLDYVVFADWIFFGLAAASLFVLRRRDGDRAISFRVPLHPVSTLLFIAAACYVVIGSVASNPGNALRGGGLILLGVPVYLYWRSRAAPRR